MGDEDEVQAGYERDIQTCRKVFATYDTNDTGHIDYYDLKDALEKMNISFSHSYVYFKMITDMQKRDQNDCKYLIKKSLLIKPSTGREQVFTE